MVEAKGIEPSTSALRTLRSPKLSYAPTGGLTILTKTAKPVNAALRRLTPAPAQSARATCECPSDRPRADPAPNARG